MHINPIIPWSIFLHRGSPRTMQSLKPRTREKKVVWFIVYFNLNRIPHSNYSNSSYKRFASKSCSWSQLRLRCTLDSTQMPSRDPKSNHAVHQGLGQEFRRPSFPLDVRPCWMRQDNDYGDHCEGVWWRKNVSRIILLLSIGQRPP